MHFARYYTRAGLLVTMLDVCGRRLYRRVQHTSSHRSFCCWKVGEPPKNKPSKSMPLPWYFARKPIWWPCHAMTSRLAWTGLRAKYNNIGGGACVRVIKIAGIREIYAVSMQQLLAIILAYDRHAIKMPWLVFTRHASFRHHFQYRIQTPCW